MLKVILLTSFVVVHSSWCLFEIFAHSNVQFVFHLIAYYVTIKLLKLKSNSENRKVENSEKEMILSPAITPKEEEVEKNPEIENNLIKFNKKAKFKKAVKDSMKSKASVLINQQKKDAFWSSNENTSAFTKFWPSTQRRAILESPGHTIVKNSQNTLSKLSKYKFSAGKGKSFTIDNSAFEKDENELIEIFENHKACYFIPIPANATTVADEDVELNECECSHKKKKTIIRKMKKFFRRIRKNKGSDISY
ncbi:hypothetical protein NPIL_297871 [Nephila pilipes]|uniref:Uncharacterized protein n=1 Tax=Nephila pilipes TaxID=299642 RepID=A0A8X6QHI8_NEPPI|nr:hypothetical protein NPIL_297871 [Nephila pilipes]